jgi:glycosyltransferase involved in cell wall biosynthesis
MNNEALIVVGRLGYPGSNAPSNRVHLYCKALKLKKGFPFVINLHSTFSTPQTFNYLDRHDGIPFYFAQKSVVREKNFVRRNLYKIIALFNTMIVIRRLRRGYRPKVLFYNTALSDEVILFFFLKALKISIVKDCSEAPQFIIQTSPNIRVNTLFLRLRLKMYSELIVISDYLNRFYSKHFPQKSIFQIPILVDMERFNNHSDQKSSNDRRIITYVGFMGGNKDGLENLIESMLIVKKRNSNIRLQLVGSAEKKDMQRLRNKVSALDLADIINFLGRKTAREIPKILCDSDILVLARPDNNQAKAGFPTKLGEYLASGKPVVITDTGEVSRYLSNNISAYLARPDDVKDFAEKILFALSDQNASKIGRKGFEIAKENFNYQLYGNQILKIVRS